MVRRMFSTDPMSRDSAPQPASRGAKMTSPVTRHLPRPPIEAATPLVAGIDTLDLGLYVAWNEGVWVSLAERLGRLKSQATGGKPAIWSAAEGVAIAVHAAGKPMYRFRLEIPEGNLYLACEAATKSFPNVYWSPASETLWSLGPEGATTAVVRLLRCMGGTVERIVPSRCDLCADVRVPGGIPLSVIRDHRVAMSDKLRPYESGSKLETCYIGSGGSPIQARIYDKSLEIVKSAKLSMNSLWGTVDEKDAWRFEFQLRRPALKRFGIESLADLQAKAAGLWIYLTSRWLTLRAHDHVRAARRSTLPLWVVVQSCSARFTGDLPCAPVYRDPQAKLDWYCKHVAGCVPSMAALLGINEIDGVLPYLTEHLRAHWAGRDAQSAIQAKAIRFGRRPHATLP